MQEQCIKRIKPGVHYRDLQILAMAIATRRLMELGILRNGTLKQILLAGTIRAFFPHGLGHHVGLDVHDVLHVPIQSSTASSQARIDTKVYSKTDLEGLNQDIIAQLYDTLINSTTDLRPVLADGPVLEAGMVVTVEPGLYFSDFALSKVYLCDPKIGRAHV